MNKITPAKRINIVSIKMVKEGSILYDVRQISTPSDAAGLGRKFLEDSDREQVIVCCLDTKNQPYLPERGQYRLFKQFSYSSKRNL